MQEQEQMAQRQQMYQQLQSPMCVVGPSSSVCGIGPTCICEIGSGVIDEDEVGSTRSGASGSGSLGSGGAGALSTSPGGFSTLLGSPGNAYSLNNNANNNGSALRHNSLCEIHGKIVSLRMTDELLR